MGCFWNKWNCIIRVTITSVAQPVIVSKTSAPPGEKPNQWAKTERLTTLISCDPIQWEWNWLMNHSDGRCRRCDVALPRWSVWIKRVHATARRKQGARPCEPPTALKFARVVPLRVQQLPGSDDGLHHGVGSHRLLGRGFGAGVGLSALLVAHGFDVAAAPHPTARDLVVLLVARVTPPVVLGHLAGARGAEAVNVLKCPFWWLGSSVVLSLHELVPQSDIMMDFNINSRFVSALVWSTSEWTVWLSSCFRYRCAPHYCWARFDVFCLYLTVAKSHDNSLLKYSYRCIRRAQRL